MQQTKLAQCIERTKRMLAIALCAFVAMSCIEINALAFADDTQTSAATRTLPSKTITVGVPTDRCPMFYEDASTHKIVGIGVDLMRAAAKEAGYSVTFRRIEEETLKQALDNEEYDVVMPFGSAIEAASGRASIVSDNLIQTPFTLVTAGDRMPPSLSELHVGMLSSLAAGAETVRELYPGIDITLYDTMPECVAALRRGEVDALLHNSYVWSYVLQKPSYSDLTVQPMAMFSMDFRAGTLDTPDGRALIDRLNGGIAKLTDTQRQAFILDHTARRLYHYDVFDYLYLYGLIIALVVILFASLVIIVKLRFRSLRLEQDKKVREIIDHDPLTGLLSLDGFRRRVADLLHEHPDVHYLLSYNNIRNFKYINDSLGREVGDDLLRFWARKSLEALSNDEAIGRVGGDHFAVLRAMGGDAQMLSDEVTVIDPVRSYLVDRGEAYRVQICTGVYVLTPNDYARVDVDRMIDFARVAERKVSTTAHDGYWFYNPNEWERGKRVADVVSHLQLAIQSGELQVWYQPQVDFETGEITGAEALCRWNHQKLGWISPAEFITTLEEAGLIYDMDKFVWRRVCEDLRRWNRAGCHKTVSVNVSRCDIGGGHDIPEIFRTLVQSYGLTEDQLHIEITETAYVENPELLIRTTTRLRELGFQVEMDDFGSGYSSLCMLKELPVDRIKLDLHFLTNTDDVDRSRIIVSHVIEMVNSLGMQLIAEGVETQPQAEFLHSRGCNEMQGYYFYKPMPASEFEALGDKLA